MMNARQYGFTLIEIAIVLLIVSILLGYTVALFPRQQELKQYRDVEREMDKVIAAIVGFAQVNGRLPCPASPDTLGVEDDGGTPDCDFYGGFVPVNTLGISGRLNGDSLLLDPWGNPYQYTNFDNVPKGEWRKDRNLVPLNTDYDLWSMGKDGKSKPPIMAKDSHDDIIRANDGQYVGRASEY